MKRTVWLGWTCVLLLIALVMSSGPKEAAGQPKPGGTKRLLVVTVTKGFRHSSIPTAEKILGELAEKNGWELDYVRDDKGDDDDKQLGEKTTAAALKKYDGVIFANTTGNVPLADLEGFISWIKSGKAFIGMHSASDTLHSKDKITPYVEMLGGQFESHGAQVEVECLNQDPEHPATRHLGKSYTVKDEIYILANFVRSKVHGLLGLDKHPNNKTPGDYPIAWCKEYGRGRVFYTSLGHREDVWESEPYQKHVVGGIKWALGLEPGSGKPQSH